MNIPEICDYFESDLGACAYNRDQEKYVIYYNDTKNNRGLKRFTVAHELGHIFLKHHQDTETDIILRTNISETKYSSFENEANCFARNLLSPIPLVQRITDINHVNAISDIMNAFVISYKAAVTRRIFYEHDNYRMTADFYSFFNNFTILYGYYCFHCGNAEIGSTGYCKICGTEVSIFAKSCSRIFYTGVKVNENGRAIKCPRCGNEAFSPKEKYCNICGASLFNVCEGVSIVDSYGNIFVSTHHINDGNARYCSKCGSRTAFYKQGFLKKWTAANNVEYQHDAVAETRPDLYEMKDGS